MKLYDLPADQVFAIKEATDSLLNRLGVLDLHMVKSFYLCVRFSDYRDYIEGQALSTFKLTEETYSRIVDDIEHSMLTKYGTKVSFNLVARNLYCKHTKKPRHEIPQYCVEVMEYAKDLRYNYLWKLNTQATRLINKRIKEGK